MYDLQKANQENFGQAAGVAKLVNAF